MINISIIIPVYNCEKYIELCITSALEQTIESKEVICIDDGSTDDSVGIIKGIVERDSRVKLIQQKNQGAGVARNVGIEAAKGKYITFLDADDYYLEKDALDKMICICEEIKVEACGSIRYLLNENENHPKPAPNNGKIREMSQKHIIYYKDEPQDYDFSCYVFLRELLVKNNICFPAYSYFEDPPFLVRALHTAQKFKMSDAGLYCYRVPNVASKWSSNKTQGLLNGMKDNLHYAIEHDLDKLFELTLGRLEYEYCNLICHSIPQDDANILALLWEINHLVCNYLKNPEYVIRPLKKVLYEEREALEDYPMYLQKILEKEEKVFIYGAGMWAQKFLEYLRDKDAWQKVKSVIVSNKTEKDCVLAGIPVISMEDYIKFSPNIEGKILVATGGIFHYEISKLLKEKELNNFELIDDVFLKTL